MPTKELILFDCAEFGNIRVVMVDGNPLFVASDVARALGYANPAEAVQDHYKKVNKISQHSNLLAPPVSFNVIPEADVYRLIIRSNLPNAEKFECKVMEEILPSIRRTGGYIAAPDNATPEEILARAVLVADDTIKRLKEKTAQLELQVEADRPKVIFADSVTVSKTTILVGELAKLIAQSGGPDLGQNRLFHWLRERGYLHKTGSQRNLPTQKSIDMDLIVIKEGTRIGSSGESHLTRPPKITGKGQIYFVNKFMNKINLAAA